MMLTPFQQNLYELCRKIPRGNVTTYKELAQTLGTKAYRAVGMALNKNPFAPKVPCHRVVSTDGTIGGFAHGKRAKKRLLQHEGISFDGHAIKNFSTVFFRF